MAWTARSEDEKKEYFDSPEELEKKVSRLAEWVKESKHMIIFTVSLLLLNRFVFTFSGCNTLFREQASVLQLAVSPIRDAAVNYVELCCYNFAFH